MLDQSFSERNFENIFDIETRKTNINDKIGVIYQTCIHQIQEVRKDRQKIYNKKKNIRTEDDIKELDKIEEKIVALLKKKCGIKERKLKKYSDIIYDDSFQFTLKSVKNTNNPDKNFYAIDGEKDFFAMKQLEMNLKTSFNVLQSSRHKILSQIKILLRGNISKYIIRTDITSFFESIPQKELLLLIDGNEVLSQKSKQLIHQIFGTYNSIRIDNSLSVDNQIGIPRGIGISSYLAEIYMKGFDDEVKDLCNVVYYARYVDDIFIIMIPNIETIDKEYEILVELIKKYKLSLHVEDSEKCKKIFINRDRKSNTIFCESINYLGYQIYINEKNKGVTEVNFGLSQKKKKEMKRRIDCVFKYFNNRNHNIKESQKILLSSLRLLSTNVNLLGAKSHIRTGIYYSNDLLDEKYYSDIKEFDEYLKGKLSNINPCLALFTGNKSKKQTAEEVRLLYIDKLSDKILKICNFKKGYCNKVFSSISRATMINFKKICH